jgi:hypothetical protein
MAMELGRAVGQAEARVLPSLWALRTHPVMLGSRRQERRAPSVRSVLSAEDQRDPVAPHST